jgi:hypothetical protein
MTMSDLNERPAAGNSNIALWVLVPFVMGVLANVATNYFFALPYEPLGIGFAGIQMALGFLPNLVAASRNHHQKTAIFALNVGTMFITSCLMLSTISGILKGGASGATVIVIILAVVIGVTGWIASLVWAFTQVRLQAGER